MFNKSTNYPIVFVLAILLYFMYLFVNFVQDPNFYTVLSTINIAIHEGGHAALLLLGNQFLTVIAGTLMQLLVPVGIMYGFLKNSDYFGYYLGYGWLGINLFGISVYAGDAKSMSLPMLKFFGEGTYINDWNYIFTKLGILGYTEFISKSIYFLAIVCFIICFLFSGSLIYNKYKNPWL